MFSLQQLFGKGDKFFDLLEASAEQARNSAQALVTIMRDPSPHPSLEEFIRSRREDKRITESISEQLVKTFVTALEREDIEALSVALYKIPKTTEKFAERFSLAAGRLKGVNFERQGKLVHEATDIIVAMVKVLRKIPPLEEIKQLNDRLQQVEGAADDVMNELLKELYDGKFDPIAAYALGHLYELLEKIIDRCRDVGNVVTHIALKNS